MQQNKLHKKWPALVPRLIIGNHFCRHSLRRFNNRDDDGNRIVTKKEYVFFSTITSDWLVYRLSQENHSVFGSVLIATFRPRTVGLHQAMGSMRCAVLGSTMVTYDWCITNLTYGWWVSPKVELFLTISMSKKKRKMRRCMLTSSTKRYIITKLHVADVQ